MEDENPGPSRIDDLSLMEKNQLGLYDAVNKILREVESIIPLKYEHDVVTLIAELTWKKLKIYSQDLEAFSKHGKRSLINIEDVRLLTRRNPSIEEFIKNIEIAKPKRQSKKMKKETE